MGIAFSEIIYTTSEMSRKLNLPCRTAFANIKTGITFGPVLRVPRFGKVSELVAAIFLITMRSTSYRKKIQRITGAFVCFQLFAIVNPRGFATAPRSGEINARQNYSSRPFFSHPPPLDELPARGSFLFELNPSADQAWKLPFSSTSRRGGGENHRRL